MISASVKRLSLAIVTVLFLGFTPQNSSAVAVLDQSQLVSNSMAVCVGTCTTVTFDTAQTFTVGQTGVLSQLDLVLNDSGGSGNLFIDIRTTTASGYPTETNLGSNILGSVSLSSSFIADSSYQWVSVDLLSLGITVTAGDNLAIVLRTSSGYGMGAAGNYFSTNDYTGGQMFIRDLGLASPSWQLQPGEGSTGNWDLAFRTYVNVAAIPEPTSLTLFCFGLAMLLGRGLKRRRDV